MKKKYKNILLLVILLCFLTLNMLSIDTIVLKIWEYTELFIKRIFPVSFIFITLSNLLIEYNFIQLPLYKDGKKIEYDIRELYVIEIKDNEENQPSDRQKERKDKMALNAQMDWLDIFCFH